LDLIWDKKFGGGREREAEERQSIGERMHEGTVP